ncbi:hypothetical protein WI70_24215 [Burkholderia cepacia]|nr:hypothetical protein WI47_07505 [Burkholderia cepacia]KVC13672.1 hypothetical protein WI70_24215 [Burkholderia cepacia]
MRASGMRANVSGWSTNWNWHIAIEPPSCPAPGIDALEWNADMIVMGTHGRRGVTGWLVGSVAGRVARITKTPVLLVHASRA